MNMTSEHMTSVMDGMQDIILGTLLCHEKCKRVHLMVKVAHATKEHLRGYNDIPDRAVLTTLYVW